MSSTQPTKLPELDTESDWKVWWNCIALAAKKRDVFRYIDIDKEVPEYARTPKEPVEPSYRDVKGPIVVLTQGTTSETTREPTYSDLDPDEREQLRRLQSKFDRDLKRYEKERSGLVDLRLVIQTTVHERHHNAYLSYKDDCYTVLIKLRDRFKPTGRAEISRLSNEFDTLCRTNKVTTTLGDWVERWQTCYDDCKGAKMGLVEGSWPIECFLKAVERIQPGFVQIINGEQCQPDAPELELGVLIKRFHIWVRNVQITKPNRSAYGAAYAAENPAGSTENSAVPVPTLAGRDQQGKDKPKRPCICEEHMYWSECPYLFEWNRPAGWKPDPKISKLIEEKKKEKYISSTIANIRRQQLEKRKREGKETPETSKEAAGEIPMSYYSISRLPSAYSFESLKGTRIHLPLLHSYLLDTGASNHVCNDRSRFTQFTPLSGEEDFMISGAHRLRVEGVGIINITVKFGQGDATRSIELRDVHYIPSFTTNLVSYDAFESKGTWLDPRRNRLEHNGITVATYERMWRQRVLEYHPISAETVYPAISSRVAKPKAKWTIQQAHSRLGHVYEESLKHLPNACSDIESVTGELEKICEVCKLHDSKKLISRREPTRAERPFYRICVDFIPMRDGHVAHIYDDCTGYNWVDHVFTTQAKDLIKPVKFAVNQAKRRWGYDVVVIRIDNQLSLLDSGEWEDYTSETGLLVEQSAPDVHEQNGAAEVSGGVLTRRAAKLKTSGNVPKSLYPECYRAAAYIQNRAPSRRLGFKSPLGYLQNSIRMKNPNPMIAHFRAYGCKAYALNHHRDQLDRLESRIHVGYLVGYSSTNIFRVWAPSLSRVISVRDVTFDESQLYSPEDELEEGIEERVRQIEVVDLEPGQEEDESEPPSRSWERSIDALNDTIVVATPRDSSPTPTPELRKDVEAREPTLSGGSGGLISPELTPQPEERPERNNVVPENSTNQSTTRKTTKKSTKPTDLPKRSTNTGLDTTAVVDWDKRSSRRRGEREAHHIMMGNLPYYSAYHAEFHRGIQDQRPGETAKTTTTPALQHISKLPKEPETWNEMLQHEFREDWLKAVDTEYTDLLRKGTFVVVDETKAEGFVVPTRFVFKYKNDEQGFVNKYKARLVVRGDLQQNMHEDTYAATLAARVFRFLMAITAYFGLKARQFDAVNAFSNSNLKQPIWIRFPSGYVIPGKVLKLLRALYGLKISPLLWFEHLSKIMEDLGMRPVPECACLFQNDKLILFFYVDDIVILFHPSNESFYDEFIRKLMERVELRSIGDLQWFLGIRILRDWDQHKIWLCQDTYLEKIALKYNLQDRKSKVPLSPLLDLVKYEGTATQEDIKRYQGMVGSIGYPAIISRPDCASALQKLSQFLTNPSPTHIKAVEGCIAYLYCTRSLALEYGSDQATPLFTGGSDLSRHFLAASDSSFADDPVRRWSTEGSLFQLFGGCIDWSSSLQKTVTTSSTEAELLALSHICAWLFWWRRVFDNLHLDLDEETTVHCDNLQTIRLMMKESPKLVTKLKHIDIHQSWLRQETEKGTVKIEWLSTHDMPADGLTKSLGPQRHQAFIKQLRLIDISDRLAEIVD